MTWLDLRRANPSKPRPFPVNAICAPQRRSRASRTRGVVGAEALLAEIARRDDGFDPENGRKLLVEKDVAEAPLGDGLIELGERRRDAHRVAERTDVAGQLRGGGGVVFGDEGGVDERGHE